MKTSLNEIKWATERKEFAYRRNDERWVTNVPEK